MLPQRTAISCMVSVLALLGPVARANADGVDFRYAPEQWQTSICRIDDPQKTLVNNEGSLLYDFPGRFSGFKTRIAASLTSPTAFAGQRLESPRVAIVCTSRTCGPIEVSEEAFASAPPAERADALLVRLRNASNDARRVAPSIEIKTELPVEIDLATRQIRIGSNREVLCTLPLERATHAGYAHTFYLSETLLPPSGTLSYAVAVRAAQGDGRRDWTMAEAQTMRRDAQRYWESLDLPCGRIQVPDPNIQALLDASIRNLYQAREIGDGLPVFQAGPTCYRNLWILDAAFILETLTMLGRIEEARQGFDSMLSHQAADGGFGLIDRAWKEPAVAIWALVRHARLTGDKAWLATKWTHIESAFARIRQLRSEAAPGLLPPGFPDGGLKAIDPEYANVYWCLIGMRAAAEGALWLGRDATAEAWQTETDTLLQAFQSAAQRDLRLDVHGNRYLPIYLGNANDETPQRGQWAFLHAVFPGKLFAPDDPLALGNLAMLRAAEYEGMVVGTGWLERGVWSYFGSFSAHARLWLGDGNSAGETLYAFANHASPLLAWREEQNLAGKRYEQCGDMPHSWAATEFVRLTRHLLALERGDELHLFEGMPREWAQAGAVTQLRGIQTEFGPLSLILRVSDDARSASLRVELEARREPNRVVVHLERWAAPSGCGATFDIPVLAQVTERQIDLTKRD